METIGPGITAGTREEAASKGIILIAVNWSMLQAALHGLLDLARQIVSTLTGACVSALPQIPR